MSIIQNLFTPRYSWNTVKVGIKHQATINQSYFFNNFSQLKKNILYTFSFPNIIIVPYLAVWISSNNKNPQFIRVILLIHVTSSKEHSIVYLFRSNWIFLVWEIGYVLIYDHKHNHDQGHITTTILSRRTYTKPSHREYSNILIQRTKTTKTIATNIRTTLTTPWNRKWRQVRLLNIASQQCIFNSILYLFSKDSR